MDVPLGLLIAAAAAGWAIVGQVVRMVFRGHLLTPREAKAMERRIDALEASSIVKDETISEFKDAISNNTSALGTNNSLLTSLVNVAQEKRA